MVPRDFAYPIFTALLPSFDFWKRLTKPGPVLVPKKDERMLAGEKLRALGDTVSSVLLTLEVVVVDMVNEALGLAVPIPTPPTLLTYNNEVVAEVMLRAGMGPAALETLTERIAEGEVEAMPTLPEE